MNIFIIFTKLSWWCWLQDLLWDHIDSLLNIVLLIMSRRLFISLVCGVISSLVIFVTCWWQEFNSQWCEILMFLLSKTTMCITIWTSIASRQATHEQQTTYKQSYLITSQLTSSFCWFWISNSGILNYKSWDVTDLPPLKESRPRDS